MIPGVGANLLFVFNNSRLKSILVRSLIDYVIGHNFITGIFFSRIIVVKCGQAPALTVVVLPLSFSISLEKKQTQKHILCIFLASQHPQLLQVIKCHTWFTLRLSRVRFPGGEQKKVPQLPFPGLTHQHR